MGESEEKGETKGFVWTREAIKDMEEFIEHLASCIPFCDCS